MAYPLAMTQAIAVTLYIAVKMEAGHYEYLSTKFISEKLGIPSPSVTKILKYLIAGGIVVTKEGAGGGISLNKTPHEITLLDVFLAVENQKPLFKPFVSPVENDKAITVGKNLNETFIAAENAMKTVLEKKTIFDLMKENE